MTTTRWYLAWGGWVQVGDAPALLDSDGVARQIEHGHYAGEVAFTDLANVRVVDGELVVTRVNLVAGERETDGDDYIDTVRAVVPVDGGDPIDHIHTRIDGRA